MGNTPKYKRPKKILTERSRAETCITTAQAHARLAHGYERQELYRNRLNVPGTAGELYIAFIWTKGEFMVRDVYSTNTSYIPVSEPAKVCREMDKVFQECMVSETKI